MKAIRLMPLLVAGLLVMMMISCGPAYVNTGGGYGGYGGYGARPYYGNNYGYRPYGYYRQPIIVRPPVVVRQRYYSPAPRYNYNRGGSPNARSGGGGNYNGGGRSRGPR